MGTTGQLDYNEDFTICDVILCRLHICIEGGGAL